MAKSAAQIISDALKIVKARQSNADDSVGAVLRDIGSEAFATELETQYTNLDNLQDIITLTDPENIDNTILETIAANYGLTRRAASAASGTVTFASASAPTSSIQIGAADGSGGITVSTPTDSNGTAISYTTSETVYLTPATPINTTTGMYEVTATIVALSTGTSTNVGANVISVLSSPITGVSSVYNSVAISNGLDIETNTSLANRIKLKLQGLVLGSAASYKSLMLQQDNVDDSYVVDPNSDFATRGPGAIDIYIDGSVSAVATQTNVYDSEVTLQLDSAPVLTISSVTGIVGGNAYVFTEGIDYSLAVDSTTVNRYSINSVDNLVWLGSTVPDLATSYTVTYTYNSLINTLQTLLEDDSYAIITNDILIKSTIGVLVNFDITVKKLSGYNSTALNTSIQTAITDFIQTDRLGKNIRQSDIVTAIEAVDGVDYVTVPFTRMSVRTSTGAADLLVEYPYEYFDVDASSFSITIN